MSIVTWLVGQKSCGQKRILVTVKLTTHHQLGTITFTTRPLQTDIVVHMTLSYINHNQIKLFNNWCDKY